MVSYCVDWGTRVRIVITEGIQYLVIIKWVKRCGNLGFLVKGDEEGWEDKGEDIVY